MVLTWNLSECWLMHNRRVAQPFNDQGQHVQFAGGQVTAYNRFGHPDELTLEELEGIATYRTDQDGGVEAVTDGKGHWPVTER